MWRVTHLPNHPREAIFFPAIFAARTQGCRTGGPRLHPSDTSSLGFEQEVSDLRSRYSAECSDRSNSQLPETSAAGSLMAVPTAQHQWSWSWAAMAMPSQAAIMSLLNSFCSMFLDGAPKYIVSRLSKKFSELSNILSLISFLID